MPSGIYKRVKPVSKETREKKSRNNSGENNPFFGKTHSAFSLNKMSISHKKNPARYWIGKKRPSPSEKTRKKISEANKKEKYKLVCEYCKNIFIVFPSGLKKKFCSRKCFSNNNKGKVFSEEHIQNLKTSHLGQPGFWTGKKRLDISGENHHNWKDGKYPLKDKIRHSPEAKTWRKMVFERDNYTCQKTKVRGGNMEVHHILNFSEYTELRFEIFNGITFSEKSHLEFHNKYGWKNNTREQIEEFIMI